MEEAENQIQCVARMDRVRWGSWSKRGTLVPKVKGFKVFRDIRLRWQGGKPSIYARIRELRSEHSATKAFWQYERRKGWAKQWRVTLIADDLGGIAAHEAWSFCKHLRFVKLLLFELALDFSPDSGIDAAFVRQHALFGRSRFRTDRGGAGQLRFGSRFSGKLVRCYEKRAVNAYRVEIELHSSLLPKARRDSHEIIESRWSEIADAGSSIIPRHIRFVKLRFSALGRHLRHRFGAHGDVLLDQTRARAGESIHSALAYLRHKGIRNPHRFLQPMPRVNAAVEQAIEKWARSFLRPCHALNEMMDQTCKSKKEQK